jgi:hypothetical protein
MLLLGSIGAFLLYVSVLSILTVVLILAAAMFMFVLGAEVEKRRRSVSEIPSKETVREVQETRTPLDVRVRA